MDTNTENDKENLTLTENTDSRESKRRAKLKSKFILEAINEEEFKDISDCDDASDYEEELKKMKHKMGNFTSEDEEFDEW